MPNLRKIFIVVAGGNAAAERHFEDTIQRKRNLNEVKNFLPPKELENLEKIYHGAPFIVWGAVPGEMNEVRWQKMEPGDILLIYNRGYIRCVGEVAAKVRSRDLARYFWKETAEGHTWELMYFIVNEEEVKVSLEVINPLFGYKKNYAPRGFSMVENEKVANFTERYGDIVGVLKTLERKEELIEKPKQKALDIEAAEELIEAAPTEHDEMQWRLIRLGTLANLDIWIPKNDQNKQYDGHRFRELVLPEFHETLDVPPSIKNIDVVWKFGPYSIKSAFEIEHSTSVYSGILRLSDLRAETPNSNYPLFIIASEARKRKVFSELNRPTFSGPGLRLNEVIRFLSYKKIREIDESYKNRSDFDVNMLLGVGESIG
ncbi:MAG: hypothetical protein WC473_06145 [Patescibacteria group bacterium]